MKVIYIADDGSLFDNEWDCEDYEWKLNHPNLKDVHVFNEEGVEFENIFLEDTYNHSAKVVVTSDEAIKDLHDLVDYTGYLYYEQIDKVGEWVFDMHTERFIMMQEED